MKNSLYVKKCLLINLLPNFLVRFKWTPIKSSPRSLVRRLVVKLLGDNIFIERLGLNLFHLKLLYLSFCLFIFSFFSLMYSFCWCVHIFSFFLSCTEFIDGFIVLASLPHLQYLLMFFKIKIQLRFDSTLCNVKIGNSP